MMLGRRGRVADLLSFLPRPSASETTGEDAPATAAAIIDPAVARRFRETALPHLDEVYSLARYLLRSADDADDAVQECYLRALRHFDTFQGPAIKPWLMAILRNVCRAEYARRTNAADAEIADAAVPLWQEPQPSPEIEFIGRKDAETIRALLASLPEPFREVLVLREVSDLSYREIANVIGAPLGTVMSRLARARALLREAWIAASGEAIGNA
jgi:RNA polymerase sigma-70 factor, ECF subfamily